MPIATHMIQPDMLEMRMASPEASAMAPSETAPSVHSHTARLPVAMMSTLFSIDTVPFIEVMSRVSLWKVEVCWASASRA
jgi:hypothetical protein